MKTENRFLAKALVVAFWLSVFAMPWVYILGFGMDGFPYAAWGGTLISAFILSTIAWPAKKRKSADKEENGKRTGGL